MSRVDLLGFGPHPDDLEIGLGGTIAKHAAFGHVVGLCDFTRGEMSSNGTPEVRMKEAGRAAQVLGAAWRENLALPDRAIGSAAGHVRLAVERSAASGPAWLPSRTGRIATPITRPPRRCSGMRCSTRSSRRYDAAGDPWQPDWVCHYFINDTGPASFVIDVSEHYDTKKQALACYESQLSQRLRTRTRV